MFELIIFFFTILLTFFFLNVICLKKNILIENHNNSEHKKLINKKKVPITGGILIIISILFFLDGINLISKFLFFTIFLLGIFSDFNILSSPKIRFSSQIIIVLVYVFLTETYISEIRIDFFDEIMSQNEILKIIFTSFCILILMNGTNFIDGANSLSSGYYFLVFLNIIFISFNNTINIDEQNTILILIILFIFLIFNIFSKSFLGDGGSYTLSFFSGIYLINLFNQNLFISPYYVVILLWYPAFENFFSLFRRFFINKKKINIADNNHLHHLLFIFLEKKLSNNKNLNTMVGMIINFFNFVVLIIANKFIYQTQKLLFILLITIISYLIVYYYLNEKLNKKVE